MSNHHAISCHETRLLCSTCVKYWRFIRLREWNSKLHVTEPEVKSCLNCDYLRPLGGSKIEIIIEYSRDSPPLSYRHPPGITRGDLAEFTWFVLVGSTVRKKTYHLERKIPLFGHRHRYDNIKGPGILSKPMY